ncbi:MAG: EamA family transporter [Clostridiales Family XIII bacterium]|nr:EamA family transporter [Clostridiales Family XIII bacterium]
MNKKSGMVSVVTAAVCYSLIPIFSILGIQHAASSPSVILFYRFLFSSLIFLGLGLSPHFNFEYHKKEMPFVFLVGTVYALQCLLFFSAFKYVSASLGEIVYHAYLIWTLLLAHFILKDNITMGKAIATAVSLLGLAMVILKPVEVLRFKGIALIILTSITNTIYLVLTKRFIERTGTFALTAYYTFICTVVAFCAACVLSPSNLFGIPSRETIIYAFLLATISTVIGFFCFNYGIKTVEVGKVAILSLSEPVFTIIIAAIILKESLSVTQTIGTGLILLSIWLYDVKFRHG